MKYTIKYSHDGGSFAPFWARATDPEGMEAGASCGDSYEDAKARLLERLRQIKPPPPEPEEIEI